MTAIPDFLNGIGAKLHEHWLGAYHASVVAGREALGEMILAQLRACGEKTKLLLAGYSQGAQITADVFQLVKTEHRGHIVGVALFGDPYYNKHSFAAVDKNLSHNGIIAPRREFPEDSRGIVLSYCHPKDPVCQGWTQIRHWTTFHGKYPDYSSLHAASKLTPYPTPGVDESACDARGRPIADLTIREIDNIVTTDKLALGPRYWGLTSSRARYRFWRLSPTRFCVVRTTIGRFRSVAGTSPGGNGRIPAGVVGPFRQVQIRRMTGNWRPSGATSGDVGVVDGNCRIGGGGTTYKCADKIHGVYSRLFAPGAEVYEAIAFDGRFTSESGQVWWKSHRAYLGDITG